MGSIRFGASWSDGTRTVEISCMGYSAASPEWDGLVTHLFVGPNAVSVVVQLNSGAGWASLSLYEFPDFQTKVTNDQNDQRENAR